MTSRTLFHGTSDENAAALCADGWRPGERSCGSQMGNPRLFYLTTTPENALWYAQDKGSSAVLEVTVDETDLIVDPQDGYRDTVEEELAGVHSLPGNLATRLALPSTAFRLLSPETKFSL